MTTDTEDLPKTLLDVFNDYTLLQEYSEGRTHMDQTGSGLSVLKVAREIRDLRLSLEKHIALLIDAMPNKPGRP